MADAENDVTVCGVVVSGDRRGRELGFPTANLLMGEDTPVADGVWAADVRIDGVRRIAVVSLGHRPTYYGPDGTRLLEAHILDFSGDLYGSAITVRLHERLRPQRRFASSVALIRQMRRDVEGVRQWAQRRRDHAGRWPAAAGERSAGGPRPEREHQRTRRIAAAVQLAIARRELSHARVAELSDVPVGFVQWKYPTLDQLRSVRATVEVSHPF